jgi:hypothetical protein
MSRQKRQKPYNPALAEYQRQQAAEEDARKRDRKSRDYNRGVARHVAPIEVADPDSKDSLERIIVMRSTRGDPLGDQHARKTISESQYQAGRAFQQDFETAENGPRAIDPAKEYVDGGTLPEPISEPRMKAVARLNRIEAALGIEGSAIVHQILVFGWTMRAIAGARGLYGRSWDDYFGKRFRCALDTMAVIYGLAMR